MDDLWANAWGSPDDTKDQPKTTTTWSAPGKSPNDDLQEDDLAMPSWSTGPGIQWDEPSKTETSLWSNAHHPAQDWSLENPYADIPLVNSRPPEPLGDKESPEDSTLELAVDSEPHPPPSSLPAPSDDIYTASSSGALDEKVLHSPVPSSHTSPEPSPPSSPDAFGVFTVGTEHSDTIQFPTVGGSFGAQIDDNEWGSPWKSAPKDEDAGVPEHAGDEWESAKLRQLEMDRRVPPELLSQILLHLEELTKDAWQGDQEVVEEDWQSRWNSRMDVEDLDRILLRYIPALTLPQLPPSGKSFSAKAMADAVKLSRNTALARTSPMSTFLAAKGSTAWETSVKTRVETSVDEVPLGWRILEKEPKKDEKIEERAKKPAGLLAGLWGRRTSNSPSNPPSQQESIPSANASTPEIIHPVPTQDPRSSMDGTKTPSGTPSTPQVFPQPSHERSSSQDEGTPVSPSGSAVSRFLQRFSRPRALSSSSRNSLALSGDDLEFLSDVRSQSTDPAPPVDALIAGLESATEGTKSGILYGKLPPPLPPPPNASSPSPHGLIAPPRGKTPNRNTLISPDDPIVNPILDLRGPPEKPNISTLTPLIPDPGRVIDPPRSMSPNSALFPPLPSDKITASLSVLPSSSSQPGSFMSLPSVSQPQPQQVAHPTQSFDMSEDDDDFSDFRSSPADPPLLSLNVSLPSSNQGKVLPAQSSQTQSSSAFDDLVHLMSSPITGSPHTFEEPDVLQPFGFGSQALSPPPSLPKSRESQPQHRPLPSLNLQDTAPTHTRSNSERPISPPKVVPTSPKQKMIAQGHQRTQSLLDLAAARRGRWPAPPSPLPEPLQPPPVPSDRDQGGGMTNVDYFGATTPTDDSSIPPPPPPGKISLLPSPTKVVSPQVESSTRGSSPPSVFDALAQPRTGSPSFTLSAPPTGPSSARRALSPPPFPSAIMNTSSSSSPSKPPSSSTPVPLLPPPSGYRFVSPAKVPSPPPPQFSPESTPLALLMDNNDKGKTVSLPTTKPTPTPTPTPPVKGTGGLTAQDLSFFEGL